MTTPQLFCCLAPVFNVFQASHKILLADHLNTRLEINLMIHWKNKIGQFLKLLLILNYGIKLNKTKQ